MHFLKSLIRIFTLPLPLFFTAATLISTAACVPTPSTKDVANIDGFKIVDGQIVAKDDVLAKSVVMITLDSEEGGTYVCTGTLISTNLILTADHCLSDQIQNMGITFGVNPFAGKFQFIEIVKTFREDPNPRTQADKRVQNFDNHRDLALIQFKGGLPAGAAIMPLGNPADTYRATLSFQALGFGVTKGTDQSPSSGAGKLRRAELVTTSFAADKSYFTVDQSQGRGTCFGDSGGPAVIINPDNTLTQFGVASAVFTDQNTNEYHEQFDPCGNNSLYINLAPFLGWIAEIQAQVDTEARK